MICVGICGGSCSGKTTLAGKLKTKFGEKAVVIGQDSYYIPRPNISFNEKRKINFDCPQALDNELLKKHIRILKSGKGIECPVYDFSIHDRSDMTIFIPSAEIIIVEGILLFEDEELRNLLDYKIFIDCDSDVCLARRILRDTLDRGRSQDDIVRQYRETVAPMYELYINPYKKYADILITDISDIDYIIKKIGI